MHISCYLCGHTVGTRVHGKVRDLPTLKILKCNRCGLVFLQSTDHISDDYYTSSQMRDTIKTSAWPEWLQKCATDDERRAQWIKPLAHNKTVLDIGCGAGGFLLLTKPFAKSVQGVEIETYFQNLLNKEAHIPVHSLISDFKDKKFDIISFFHVLEHLKDPVGMLAETGHYLRKQGKIIIEVPNINDALLSLYKSEPFSNFTFWSAHLFMYSAETLANIIEKAGLKVNHIDQVQRYPLSNHLYWLAKGVPGGDKEWSFLDSPSLTKAYQQSLSKIGGCDTLLATVSLK